VPEFSSGVANHAIAQVGGVASLDHSHRLELDGLGEVFKPVEQPPPGPEQDRCDVDLDLVELPGPDGAESGRVSPA
jgi:hypothetical protein